MGRHSKPSKTKTVLRRTGATAAIAGATFGGIGIAGAGTASAFPGQAGLVKCESGGNPTAVNNTAAGQRAGRPAGLFQIVTKTWLANGGGQFAPTADKATPAQQQTVADRIYAKQGSAPWQCPTGAGSAQFAFFGGQSGGGSASTETAKVRHEAKPTNATPAGATRSNPTGNYTVVAGDTLSGIAAKFRVSGGWQHLQKANSQYIPNADLILVGQRIATS
ncbi:LysM peptidoglycan-binding domain-containing protein [Amycolatopsis alkalitolerans]|uniref:LysM peptidoglycan-binding domain-containing protein n=1 Tax=Amycolatopsis alkalitolerans TaxID=2547244 RepID=A0A5C4LRE7_9PSEU|nr:transglycosylase family protein [Amycolatopsis alkalitolerans]TNC20572.1 LysM peptidoglycan-binding domain-containing protein [Amycolatopsis alkalitolerans]